MIYPKNLWHRNADAEPDVGLDPGTPGLRPGPKAGAKTLSHPGIHPPLKF